MAGGRRPPAINVGGAATPVLTVDVLVDVRTDYKLHFTTVVYLGYPLGTPCSYSNIDEVAEWG